jgi:hypothetical protein
MLTKISLKVACELSSGPLFDLERFFKQAKPGEIFDFCHYNFYYSYPEWNKKWPGGKELQFHQVHTCCNKCQEQPERNYAGIGSLYLLMNENRKASLLCDDCAKGLKEFGEREKYVQAAMF